MNLDETNVWGFLTGWNLFELLNNFSWGVLITFLLILLGVYLNYKRCLNEEIKKWDNSQK